LTAKGAPLLSALRIQSGPHYSTSSLVKQSFVVVPRGIKTDPDLALSWLLLWPSQFTSKFRWKSPWFHRFLGTVLMIDAALILSGVLAMCANGAC
jgi:hypothetical protein